MTTAAELASYASSFPSFRNRIINGNFEIWQRGNTSRTFGNAGVYSADRWCRSGYQSAAHERVTVSSPVAGMTSRYAIRSSSCTTAEDANGSRMTVDQKIESVNCYDLAGKQITFSFWIRFSSTASSLGSSFSSRVQYNTSNTDSTTLSDLGDGNICGNDILSTSLPTAWTKITKTGLVPAGVQNLTPRFQFNNLVSTASAGSEWFEITEVQVEEGTVPTPFEHRPIGTELALCQRYAIMFGNNTVNNTGDGGNFSLGFIDTIDNFAGMIFLPTTMRERPVLNAWGTSNFEIAYTDLTISTVSGVDISQIQHISTKNLVFFTIGSGQTNQHRQQPASFRYATNSNTDAFLLESEL